MLLKVRSLMLGFVAAAAVGSATAGEPVTWTFLALPGDNDTVQVQMMAVCQAGWHIYAMQLPPDEGPLPTVVQLEAGPDYRTVGEPMEPEPFEDMDPNFGMVVRFHSGNTVFRQDVERATAEAFTINGSVEYMACNDKTCLPPRTVAFTLDIKAAR